MSTKESVRDIPAVRVEIEGQPEASRFARPFRIGRSSTNDVVIESELVSQRHAEVFLEDGGWWIRDLESTNGTVIGGKEIDRFPLKTAVRVRLGYDGPALLLSVEGTEHEARPTVADQPSESQIIDRYLGDRPPEDMGRHTEMVREVLKKETERRSQKYIFALLILTLLVAGASMYAFIQRRAIQRQRAAAAEVFYAMKSLELEVAKLQLTADAATSYRERRSDLEKRYSSFLEELGIYSPKTPERTQIIYRVIHRFGESEANVPKEFVQEVGRYIDRWKKTPRLQESIARAAEHQYGPRIAEVMLEHDMPPELFYLALQESEFKLDAVGPETRFGIAKGMWQLIPGTARQYGLHTGPLVGVRRFDPRDERHDFETSTRAAALYLRDIYTTDAQASGLLVVAAYNWGQTRVLRLIRSLPENPSERNFWKLLTRYRDQIPSETYNYVFNVVSAAVIGEKPALFGFQFDPPLPRSERDSVTANLPE